MIPFSVSICVYNKDNAQHFKKAIESVTVNQSLKPNEVIIVVDGPVHGDLKDTIKQYEKCKDLFKVIWLPNNVGHAGARRVGFEASSYEIIAIMDADDIAVSKRFEKQISFMNVHPDIAVVGGQISEFIDEPHNVVGKRLVPENDADIKYYLKSRCPMNLVTVMLRKSLIEKVGGFLDWYCEEDYYLWIRMVLADCKFANLPDILVKVRVGKDMYARRGGRKYYKSERDLQTYMFKHKLISFPKYILNIAIRFIIQVIMPNKLRGFIFQKLLRQ